MKLPARIYFCIACLFFACIDAFADELPASAAQSTVEDSCRNPAVGGLSRFWELEPQSDCGTFGIRGYRPISMSLTMADAVNSAPSTPSPNHTAQPVSYSSTETRIQLSVRTKLAQGLLNGGSSEWLDSIWFAYSEQSYWQTFSADISRPFHSTDHEPEVIYIYPVDLARDDGFHLRYLGVSANHWSNGESNPLSRSWNRIIAKAGMELGKDLVLTANLWQRIPEPGQSDDNPDLVQYMGNAEVSAMWSISARHSLSMTVRRNFDNGDNGSARLIWYYKPEFASSKGKSALRLHADLFTGYGESLIDYNYRRTVLNLGLSLLDW